MIATGLYKIKPNPGSMCLIGTSSNPQSPSPFAGVMRFSADEEHLIVVLSSMVVNVTTWIFIVTNDQSGWVQIYSLFFNRWYSCIEVKTQRKLVHPLHSRSLQCG